MEYLLLGKIIDTFGLDGTVKVISSTNNQDIRYKKGSKVFAHDEKEDTYLELTIKNYRSNGKFDFISFNEFKDINDAEIIKGNTLEVIKNRNDLDVGYYFYSDLVGCKVLDENNNTLGTVSIVEEFPAQITLRVKRPNRKDFFVPFLEQFIKNVDVEKKEIHINVMEGML